MSPHSSRYTAVVAGGGTGGHFYPAMAVAAELEQRFSERFPGRSLDIHYIGSSQGIEASLMDRYPYPHLLVNVKGFRRSLHPADIGHNALFLSRTLRAFLRIRRYLRRIDPLCVIATGSYSAGLPLAAASSLKIPYYIQEQNAFPGMVNRLFAGSAAAFFYAYEEVLNHIAQNSSAVYSGNPVRSAMIPADRNSACREMRLDPRRTTVFIFGGSQGSRAINRSVIKFIPVMLRRWPVQILWQTGEAHFQEIRDSIPPSDHLHIKPFIHTMETAYSAADLVISRAGALSLAELQAMQKAAVLIPLPTAAANHQLHNARSLEKTGAVIVIEEKELPAGSLFNAIQMLMDDPARLRSMQQAMASLPMPETLDIITGRILDEVSLD